MEQVNVQSQWVLLTHAVLKAEAEKASEAEHWERLHAASRKLNICGKTNKTFPTIEHLWKYNQDIPDHRLFCIETILSFP